MMDSVQHDTDTKTQPFSQTFKNLVEVSFKRPAVLPRNYLKTQLLTKSPACDHLFVSCRYCCITICQISQAGIAESEMWLGMDYWMTMILSQANLLLLSFLSPSFFAFLHIKSSLISILPFPTPSVPCTDLQLCKLNKSPASSFCHQITLELKCRCDKIAMDFCPGSCLLRHMLVGQRALNYGGSYCTFKSSPHHAPTGPARSAHPQIQTLLSRSQAVHAHTPKT